MLIRSSLTLVLLTTSALCVGYGDRIVASQSQVFERDWVDGAIADCGKVRVVAASPASSFSPAPTPTPTAREAGTTALMGILSTTNNKPITVNGASTVSGATIPSGTTIETPAGVGATIRLRALGSLCVAPITKLTLEFDRQGNIGSLKITLTEGCVILRTFKSAGGTINSPQGIVGRIDAAIGGAIDVCLKPGAAATINQGAAVDAGAGASVLDCGAAGAAAQPTPRIVRHTRASRNPIVASMAQSNSNSSPIASPSPNANTNTSFSSKLKGDANVVFTTPASMKMEETKDVELLVSPSESVEKLKETLSEPGSSGSGTTKYAERMEAQLAGTGFDITPIGPAIQPVEDNSTTTWKWQIKPKDGGAQRLDLTLNAVLNDGKDKRMERTFHRDILINVSFTQRATTFIGRLKDVQWLWVAIIVPLAGAIYGWWRKKRSKTDKDK